MCSVSCESRGACESSGLKPVRRVLRFTVCPVSLGVYCMFSESKVYMFSGS